MTVHFEELWEKCENFHKEASKNMDAASVVEGLTLKLNLYKALVAQTDILGEDMQKVKSRTLGEIVLTLTCLSLKDNINVYESLSQALQMRSIDFLEQKHS